MMVPLVVSRLGRPLEGLFVVGSASHVIQMRFGLTFERSYVCV